MDSSSDDKNFELPDGSGKDTQPGTVTGNADQLQRSLDNRKIQLIAIGGSIGTALFISIGTGLEKGGPGSLFIAYTAYSCIIALVNNCMAEMSVLMPITGGFIRMSGHWVDDALGFMTGWNFFFYEALLIPFEITAITSILSFWRDDIPAAAVCAACIVIYFALNIFAVGVYGEAEFWLSGGKVILVMILLCFTFFTMVGANPQHWAYGFYYWQNPGAFNEYHSQGSLGKFEGFLGALWSAAFTIVGPEYISMVAAEARHPTTYIKSAFKTTYVRFALFFIGGALCVGIVIPYNDKALTNGEGSGTANASPYVIAMRNLGITGLPDLTNALMLTSVLSAGNTYTYVATRNLYGLALEGRAPRVLQKCTKNGVPIYCFAIVLCFPVLSFLQLGDGSNKVLTWLVDLITAGGLIDYIVICVTYLRFYYACQVQGVDRKTLPYYGYFQPYGAWIALATLIVVVACYGYTSLNPFKIADFFTYYTMVLVAPILYFGWKFSHKTRIVPLAQIDLVWLRPSIDAYEASLEDEPTTFWTEILALFGWRKTKQSIPNDS